MNQCIKYEYILGLKDLPGKSCDLFFDLYHKNIDQDDAYEIITNIPMCQKHKTPEEIYKIRYETVNHNYTWFCILHFKHYFPVNIIKELLKNYVDYYYINIIDINRFINNPENAFIIMKEFMKVNQNYVQNYYALRTFHIPRITAYEVATVNYGTSNMYQLLCYEYTDLEFLKKAIYLSVEQLEFLKLSRFCYPSTEMFNKYKARIFNNALNKMFININDFDVSERGEFIINQ